MSELDDDIARGYLENGEPIEARWGSGHWSLQEQMYEQEPELCQCPFCYGNAYFLYSDGIDCENCGVITEEKFNKKIAELQEIK